jgi:predicted solute-binding protein
LASPVSIRELLLRRQMVVVLTGAVLVLAAAVHMPVLHVQAMTQADRALLVGDPSLQQPVGVAVWNAFTDLGAMQRRTAGMFR